MDHHTFEKTLRERLIEAQDDPEAIQLVMDALDQGVRADHPNSLYTAGVWWCTGQRSGIPMQLEEENAAAAAGGDNMSLEDRIEYERKKGQRIKHIDMEQGMALLKRAADEHNHTGAMFQLGVLYASGTLIETGPMMMTMDDIQEVTQEPKPDQNSEGGADEVARVVEAMAGTPTAAASTSAGHIPRDAGIAFEYFDRAANLGHGESCIKCAELLQSPEMQAVMREDEGGKKAGDRARQDLQTLITHYLTQASELNTPTAHLALAAHLLETAATTPPSANPLRMQEDFELLQSAYDTLDTGAALGHLECNMYLGYLIHRRMFAEVPSLQHLGMADALRFLEIAASRGHHPSELYLAKMYLNGDGVERNVDLFVKYIRDAAEHGSAEAHAILGDCYYSALHTFPTDYELARRHYHLAGDLGNADAMVSLGSMAFYGLGMEQSYEHAYACYYRAAQYHHPTALRNIADMFERGLFVPQDKKMAAYYKDIAQQFDEQGGVESHDDKDHEEQGLRYSAHDIV
eukprot:TRINITY_DN6705_c0_g3_i1.p1 TRINITY_DN6705_c0_g3~~TRINITY_DN6705_c0_g3_i1.p1  ORF type:complete len:535 (-),score=150.78 TRINITY_DN6705_c0_g3_i1:378-1931(-)